MTNGRTASAPCAGAASSRGCCGRTSRSGWSARGAASSSISITRWWRGRSPGYGLWVFPGGFVDRGETVEAAALREAREEASLEIRLDHLINIYSYPSRAPVIIVYAATAIGGCLTCDDESLEGRYFAPDEIPWDNLAFRSTQEALREYLDGHMARRGRP